MATENTETNTTEKTRGLMKTYEGYVASSKMSKTVRVEVVTQKKHSRFGKYVKRTKSYYAHDEKNECREGDRVAIVSSRPLSKLKRWRVQKILERAK